MNEDKVHITDINIKDEDKKADIIFDKMQALLKGAYRLAKVTINTKDINNVIKNYNREIAIFLIAKNVRKYENILVMIILME